MPLSDLINFEKELERLQKEKETIAFEVKRAKGKLANDGFVNNAPEHLVKEEKEKLEKYEEMLVTAQERIESVKEKL